MSAVPLFPGMSVSDEDVDLQSWGWTDLCVPSPSSSSVVLVPCVRQYVGQVCQIRLQGFVL